MALRPNAAKPTESWHDDIVKVHEGINSLPKRERDVFVLAILEGISQAEVARQLGLQVNSVSGLLSRARKRLQAQFKTKETLSVVALTVVVSAQAGVPVMLFTQTCRLAVTTSGVPLPVLALTASLTEISMRKSLLIALLPVFLCSGMIGGTFLLTTTNAHNPQEGPRKDDLRSNNSYDTRTRERYSVPIQAWQKWEYKTIHRSVNGNTDAEMNALGDQGWELSGTNVVNGSNQVMLIFKRPKQTTVTNINNNNKETIHSDFVVGNLVGIADATFTDKTVSGNTEYRQFHLQRSNASDVADVLKKTFGLSTIVCDARTNSLHVQCDPKALADIKQLIQKREGTESASDSAIKR